MKIVRSRTGEEYWENTRYRPPEHPVVKFFAERKLALLERMREKVGLGPLTEAQRNEARVLELGAGPGIFTLPLTRRFGRVVALDLSEVMLRPNPWGRRLLGDGLRLPFKDETFDIVFGGNLLHHLDDPVACLRECARVLRRRGGLMLSVEPNALHPLMFFFGLLVREERRLIRYTPGHLRRMAERGGFSLRARRIVSQVFQNTTARWMLPLLSPFEDINWPLGGYQLSVLARR